MSDALQTIAEQVRAARAMRRPLRLRGGGSKDFYGGALQGHVLDLSGYSGIVEHEPSELVVTARCGTRIAELEATLERAGQCLAFEPPHFGPQATVGGMVAAGLSGPARASAGAVRDHVLGVRVMNAAGEMLEFGGRVMKNVAGFDLARLHAGSMGILGPILEVSLKVVPQPQATQTLFFECTEAKGIEALNRWAGIALPMSASLIHDQHLMVRLSGAEAALESARAKLGGEVLDPAAAATLWRAVREQTHPFFADDRRSLWRLSVPSTAPRLDLEGPQLIEWGGAQRWWRGEADFAVVCDKAAAVGGHATLFRTRLRQPGAPAFHPLSAVLQGLHERLKASMDPDHLFNPGRLVPTL